MKVVDSLLIAQSSSSYTSVTFRSRGILQRNGCTNPTFIRSYCLP